MTTKTNLEIAFEAFHRDNPYVYELFKRFAGQAIASNRAHFGVSAVWERLRWETQIVTFNDDDLKLNNNHRAYYARMFMRDFPESDGFFRTRVTRGEAIRGGSDAESKNAHDDTGPGAGVSGPP